jgi:hypothetical protein
VGNFREAPDCRGSNNYQEKFRGDGGQKDKKLNQSHIKNLKTWQKLILVE